MVYIPVMFTDSVAYIDIPNKGGYLIFPIFFTIFLVFAGERGGGYCSLSPLIYATVTGIMVNT